MRTRYRGALSFVAIRNMVQPLEDMDMTTLGERLRARETREEADKMAKLEREAREQGEKARKELADVQQFFDNARFEITSDITADVPVRRITVGLRNDGSSHITDALRTYEWNRPDQRIDSHHHRYYAVWEKFKEWADSEGLEVGWKHEWDTGAMESWNVLTVKARS